MASILPRPQRVIRFGCEQNDRRFTNVNFKCILLNKKFYRVFQITLKFVPGGPVGNESALFQVMAWCWTGGKPLPGGTTMRNVSLFLTRNIRSSLDRIRWIINSSYLWRRYNRYIIYNKDRFFLSATNMEVFANGDKILNRNFQGTELRAIMSFGI